MGASLLTRIAHAADPHSTERHTWRDHDLESAVRANVTRILNTRQGSSLTCPDYGIIELSEIVHDFPDAIGLMQRAIKSTLAAYEPRLKNVQVRHIKSEDAWSMHLSFEIAGQLVFPNGRREPLRFMANLDSSTNVHLE